MWAIIQLLLWSKQQTYLASHDFSRSHNIHNDIDWSHGYELLNKELQQIVPRASRGRRYVDLLVKVWRKDGTDAWVLIHVEV